MPDLFRLCVAACALMLLMPGAAPCRAATPEGEPVFTTLLVYPVAAPRPVLGTDDKRHLAYELSFVNYTALLARVDAVAALDADTGAVLAEWQGDALAAVFRINGREPGVTLARSHSAFVFLDVALPPDASVPKSIQHRISVTRLQEASGGDEHKGAPLDPALKIPGQVTFEGAPAPVDTKRPVVLEPPLRGPGWVAFNGCCAELTSHRGSVMAFNGSAVTAERFAIDFVQLDAEGKVFVGPADRLSSYPSFGVPVHAAAGGTVVEASDGAPEQVPQAPRAPMEIDAYAGNHVVIDMGDGAFALYAHLKIGTVAVKAGDRVNTGEVIGHLGSTGNSDAPHLHFHVMDGPWPLAANGLPYEFTAFIGVGRFEPADDTFTKGAPARIDRTWFPGRHRGQLPLDLQVVDFPDR